MVVFVILKQVWGGGGMCYGGSVAEAARAEDEMPVLFLELAQVVEKGSEDSPSINTLQQGN